MPDYSASGISELPRTTAESLQHGDPRTLAWLTEAIQEGDRLNMADPSYDRIERAMRYVEGIQLSQDWAKLKYLPQVTINESRRAMQAHISTLTDLEPVFAYTTENSAYQLQADILTHLAIAEWVKTFADVALGDCIKIAFAAGTGDLTCEWDPHAASGGQHKLTPRDPRDTLPIRPSMDASIQLWQGVTLREEHPINVLKAAYPSRAHLFRPSSDSVLSQIMGRFRSTFSKLMSPADDTLSGLERRTHTAQPRSGTCVLYRTYLEDRTVNLTGKAIPMGRPGSNWAYAVAPGDRLYPRKRLIVWTEDQILYDGPNPYWHGMYPISRLKLWSLPWRFLGVPLLDDLLPIQDAINDTMHDLRLGIRQWTDPDIQYNRQAVSESTMKMLDPRRPGKKLKTNPMAGDPYKRLEGPSPQVLALALTLFDRLLDKFSDLSGQANLTALLQVRAQLPSADTMEKYHELLTPEIRYEGRMIEYFLRDIAEMQKVDYFQYMSKEKRLALLGERATSLEDFDYDPNTLIPAKRPGEAGYVVELDADIHSRDERAQYFHKQFVFTIAPSSLLAFNAKEEEMMDLQLARLGYLDFWSLMTRLKRFNVGEPPAIPLPPLKPIDPADIQALFMTGGAMAVSAKYIPDPNTGQLLEVRIPQTVTEKLQAQNMLGIGMTSNPAGRKSSGQESPKSETKSNGDGTSRQTITESNH